LLFLGETRRDRPRGITRGLSSRLPLSLLGAVVSLGLYAHPVQAEQSTESACLLPEGAVQQAAPAELCGVTTLTASTSRVIVVTLTEQVETVKPFTNPLGAGGAFEVEGEGPFVGLVLTEDLPARDGRFIIAGRLSRKPSPEDVFHAFGGPRHPDWDGTLPPGQYRLYILASGSPVTVTLKFPELEGSAELTPTAPNRFDVRELEPRIWEETDRLVYTAGEDGELHTNGVLFQSIWFRAEDHVAGDHGTCYYDGPAPEPYAYTPECGGRYGPYVSVPPGSEGFPGGRHVTRGLPPGTYGQGAWYTSVSEVQEVGAVVFWLDLD